ncbi:hypothetical protein K9M48_02335 [Candidatus Gracilibacteria bacterium]|nr:hypothetical protein [Candidatus Gracilibacteria bacterium]
MDSNLISTLQSYGFSDKEAKVYLITLELGSSPASTIARNTAIKRVTVYTILKDLKAKGAITEASKDGVAIFSAISPSVLMSSLESKYEDFKSKLPDFLAIAEKYDNNKPKVQFFEGIEGVKKMYNELLGSKNHIIRSFLGTHEVSQSLKDYLNKSFVPLRVSHKIKAKVILCQSPDNKEYHQTNKKNLIESLFIDHDIFHLPCGIDIHSGNKVSFLMFSDQEMSGLIVTSSKLHDTLASVFDFIWETNKKNAKKRK